MSTNIWWSSDEHYGHGNIIKYCNRPYDSTEEMNEALIANHNKCVRKADLTIHCGDFAYGDIPFIKSVIRRLNGQHFFVFGNHDKKTLVKHKDEFMNDCSLNIVGMDYYKETKVDKQTIISFHYGCRVWDKSHHDSWLLYGHSHGSLPPYGKSVDVGLDAGWIYGGPQYRPYSFEEIKAYMDKRPVEIVDHHRGD